MEQGHRAQECPGNMGQVAWGDSVGHQPQGQAGASVVGPSFRCCVPPSHTPPAGGCIGGPWVVSTVVPSPLCLLSPGAALELSVENPLKSVVAVAPLPTLIYPLFPHMSPFFLDHGAVTVSMLPRCDQ